MKCETILVPPPLPWMCCSEVTDTYPNQNFINDSKTKIKRRTKNRDDCQLKYCFRNHTTVFASHAPSTMYPHCLKAYAHDPHIQIMWRIRDKAEGTVQRRRREVWGAEGVGSGRGVLLHFFDLKIVHFWWTMGGILFYTTATRQWKLKEKGIGCPGLYPSLGNGYMEEDCTVHENACINYSNFIGKSANKHSQAFAQAELMFPGDSRSRLHPLAETPLWVGNHHQSPGNSNPVCSTGFQLDTPSAPPSCNHGYHWRLWKTSRWRWCHCFKFLRATAHIL